VSVMKLSHQAKVAEVTVAQLKVTELTVSGAVSGAVTGAKVAVV
jgi:hypothetical protein